MLLLKFAFLDTFRYDPYARLMTREEYDHEGMRAVRQKAIEKARGCQSWGLILGTLGRQGNPRILTTMQELMSERGFSYVTVSLPNFNLPLCWVLLL